MNYINDISNSKLSCMLGKNPIWSWYVIFFILHWIWFANSFFRIFASMFMPDTELQMWSLIQSFPVIYCCKTRFSQIQTLKTIAPLILCLLILWVENLGRVSLRNFSTPCGHLLRSLSDIQLVTGLRRSSWQIQSNVWCLNREGWNAKLSWVPIYNLRASPHGLCNRVVTLLT